MQVPLAASLPLSSLESIADLRHEQDLRVVLNDDRAWLVWDSPNPALAVRLMTIPGSLLFCREPGGWTRLGNRVPSFDLPIDHQQPKSLVHAIAPQPMNPASPGLSPFFRIPLRLLPDSVGQIKPATLLICDIGALTTWADSALTAAFDRLSGAISDRSVIVRGTPLPPIVEAARFWGHRVLCPLGLRVRPELPEAALLRALEVEPDELLILFPGDPVTHERVPLSVFVPLSRASIRMAMREINRP